VEPQSPTAAYDPFRLVALRQATNDVLDALSKTTLVEPQEKCGFGKEELDDDCLQIAPWVVETQVERDRYRDALVEIATNEPDGLVARVVARQTLGGEWCD